METGEVVVVRGGIGIVKWPVGQPLFSLLQGLIVDFPLFPLPMGEVWKWPELALLSGLPRSNCAQLIG